MARLPRLTLPGHAHHILLRGNNRQAIVVDDADRQLLIDLVFEQAQAHGVAVHAWALMDNHLHLLLTPGTADGVPRTLQALGRAYVRRFNNRHGRTGTLWDGRYRSTLVQADDHLLDCMAHIELNPVRAGLVADPRDYPWSSHRHHTGQRVDRQLAPHPVYWALGNTPFAREAAYSERVRAGLSAERQRAIVDATLHGWALGDAAFLQGLQRQTERRVARAPRGRPPLPPRTNDA